MTQMKEVKKDNITKKVEIVAKNENISLEKLLKLIADEKVVIPKNVRRYAKFCGIEENLSTKSMPTSDSHQKWKICLL